MNKKPAAFHALKTRCLSVSELPPSLLFTLKKKLEHGVFHDLAMLLKITTSACYLHLQIHKKPNIWGSTNIKKKNTSLVIQHVQNPPQWQLSLLHKVHPLWPTVSRNISSSHGQVKSPIWVLF